MRKALWISVTAVAVVAAVVMLVLWAPWSPISGGSLRKNVVEYRGAAFIPPPEPQSGGPLALPQSLPPSESPSAEQLKEAWAPMKSAADEGKWVAWAYVADADTGEVLLDEDAGAKHTPASTTKLVTAAAALAALDTDQTLTTGTSLDDSALYLWGEGDLLLSAGEGNADEVDGRAGLADLAAKTAAALERRGIARVELMYQDTFFEGPKRNPVWEQQEVQDYAGDTGAFAIDTGRTAPGQWQFVEDSARSVAEAFAARLSERGIEVASIKPGQPAAAATKLESVESAPVYDQIEFMLAHSDNTLAEQYCKLAARAEGNSTTFEGATSSAIANAKALGVNTDGMVLEDCSGLSTNNRISGAQLTQVLQADRELVRMLPRSGLTGTLRDRLFEEPTLGNLQAKSGSLGIVSSLAGVLTSQSGRNLVFAVGTDKVPEEGAYWTRGYVDQFLEDIASR